MQKTYVIDGYNVIHAAPPLRRAFREVGADRARLDLANAVAGFAERVNARCIIVFDGVAESGAVTPRVEIVSSRDRSADDVIRAQARNEGPRLVVVSSDQVILSTARTNMAEIIHSKAFAAQLTLGTHSQGLAERGAREPGARESGAGRGGDARPHRIEELRQRSEKPGGMSRDELDEWKKLFGE